MELRDQKTPAIHTDAAEPTPATPQTAVVAQRTESPPPVSDADINPITEVSLAEETPFFLRLVNPGSGGQAGQHILVELEKTFKEDPTMGAVYSLTTKDGSNRNGLYFRWDVLDEYTTKHAQRPIRVIVFGGDGTVVWVLNAVSKHETESGSKFKDRPGAVAVAVQPLGTGNDMGRYLNWGPGLTTLPKADSLLEQCNKADLVNMDRWCITIDPMPEGTTAFGKAGASTKGASGFVNYYSMGVDARTVYQFEGCRSRCKGLFCCQLINKLWYGCWGGINACYCSPIPSHVSLEVDMKGDGTWEEEPMSCCMASLVVLNIGSFAAGTDLWGASPPGDKFTEPSCSDGKLEVLSIAGTHQLGCAQAMPCCVNFNRVQQAKALKFTVRSEIHMQLDGEAWLQPASPEKPTVVHVYQDESAKMLKPKTFRNGCCVACTCH